MAAITDYFVDPAKGSDSTGSGTLAAPWKSTAHALTAIVRNPNGGDRVNIKHGVPDVLTAPLDAALATYGTSTLASPLILAGYAAAQGDGGIGELNGNGLYSIVASDPSLLTLRNLKLGNCGSNGYVLQLNNECLVESCEVYGVTRLDGVGISGANNTAVRNCYVHDCAKALVRCGMVCDNLLDVGASTTLQNAAEGLVAVCRNRIFVSGAAIGVLADINVVVDRNSIYCRSGGTGAGISGNTGNTECRVTNNLIEGFRGVGGAGIADSSNHTIGTLASNRVFNCTTPYSLPNPVYFDDGNNLTLSASPFTNPAGGDLSLNTDPNGGALCYAASYPGAFQGGARTQWADCGAVQRNVNPVPAPTLTVTDNGDGTGATGVVSGSAPGSANTFYVAPWLNGSLAPIAFGPITGDGTLALNLSNGYYVAWATGTVGGLPATSSPFTFSTSGGNVYTSVHAALAAQVQSMIQGMLGTSIIGPTPQSVRVRKTGYMGDYSGQNPLPANYQYQFPAIIVCYFDQEDIDPSLGTNARDEIGYPITIVFAREGQSANTFSEDSDDLFLTWRQAVERTFTNLRGVANNKITVTAGGLNYTFHKCFPRGGLIYDPDRQSKKIDLGWIRFSFRLWRGPLGT